MFTEKEIEEIRISYREAKNPTQQIGILAELYAAPKKEIEAALEGLLPATADLVEQAVAGQITVAEAAKAAKIPYKTMHARVSTAKKKEAKPPAQELPPPNEPKAPKQLPAALPAKRLLKELKTGRDLLEAACASLEGYIPMLPAEKAAFKSYLNRAAGFCAGAEFASGWDGKGG